MINCKGCNERKEKHFIGKEGKNFKRYQLQLSTQTSLKGRVVEPPPKSRRSRSRSPRRRSRSPRRRSRDDYRKRDYRKRSRRSSASPARRSRSPRSDSPPKASHEMRRSKERSLTPLPRSRSPRSPSLEKASPERKRNDRFPSPRDKARSQSPYADVGMTAYLRRRHGDLSYYLVFVSCDRSLSKFIRVSLIHSSAKASEK
ncbi:hypothetical protein F2Q70_00000565 [Brassica cretica]|uniref:Uncharacterized protein n=1 Tax=Brassica cretica TaxID=69181 RepID=A0A8S9J1Z5_BRACR|nr:hypothetical protein F2Q70_00000565 [Brassica cretica]